MSHLRYNAKLEPYSLYRWSSWGESINDEVCSRFCGDLRVWFTTELFPESWYWI